MTWKPTLTEVLTDLRPARRLHKQTQSREQRGRCRDCGKKPYDCRCAKLANNRAA